jgi:peptidyl-prolyl cis-trans isomerase SurA
MKSSITRFTNVRTARRIIFLLGFFLIAPACLLRAEMIDKVVAVVNDEVITLSELETEAEGVYQKIVESTPAEGRESAMAEAREQILDTIIDKRLIAQKAKAQKIAVAPEEIDAALQQVLQRSKLTKEELLNKLSLSGVDEGMYRATLQTQILQNKLVSADVRAKIVVTDEMVHDYYTAQHGSSDTGTDKGQSYHLQQIGCSWQDPDGKELPESVAQTKKADARTRIDKVYAMAKEGKNFGELASQYSDLPSAADKGELGTFTAGELADYMLKAVSTLKPDELSEIVETPAGYQFFKLLEGKKADTIVPDNFSLVKEDIRKELYEQEMKKAYMEWVKELKATAYIQKL